MEVRRAYALLEQATSRRHERQAFEIAAANHENSATLALQQDGYSTQRETSIAKSALWMSNSAEGTDAPVLARPYNEICAAWGGTSYDGYEADENSRVQQSLSLGTAPCSRDHAVGGNEETTAVLYAKVA
ncbi:MAG: hypothetical protein SGPRY_001283 [Prymnesium sp.]